jgi:nucleoid-associated protein YgaU
VISAQSRYRNNELEKVPTAVGPVVAIMPTRSFAWQFNYTYFTVRQGDRIDALAREFYGDEYQWWMIARANPEILHWDSIEPGTIIRIPSA